MISSKYFYRLRPGFFASFSEFSSRIKHQKTMHVTVNLCYSHSKMGGYKGYFWKGELFALKHCVSHPARLWKKPKRTFLQNAWQPPLPAPPPGLVGGGVVKASHHPGPVHQQVYSVNTAREHAWPWLGRGLQLFSKWWRPSAWVWCQAPATTAGRG